MKTQKTALSFHDNLKIKEIFEAQKWPVDETNKSSLYKRFIRRFELLSNEQQALFMKLASLYKCVDLSEYQMHLISLMEHAVQNHHHNTGQDVWIYPIKKAEHIDIIKSSDLVAYLCKSVEFQHHDTLSRKKFHVLGAFSQVCEKKEKFVRTPLFILDDFIGSGTYVSSVIEELSENGISKENVVICSLFISETGLKRVKRIGCKVEYHELVPQITASLSSREREILAEIEEMFHVKEEDHFGFGGSANLITLIRTPNNTLPIFWLDTGRSHSAPFPR